MTAQTTRLAPAVQRAVDRFQQAIDHAEFAHLDEIFTSDALFDVNIPAWRFQRQGPDEIAAQLRTWYPIPPIAANWQARAMDGGAVVEGEERKLEEGEERYFRFVYLLFIEGDRIAKSVHYCSGPWEPATVERHRREAPMVEW